MHSSGAVSYPLIFISILATALCWGIYGPLLQWGHMEMGSGRLRPFIFVGIAYVVVAILGPILVMTLTGMELGTGLGGGWTAKGVIWSFIAGAAGALGALGMILAFNFGGKPHYVPPLIFGMAPVVNTFFVLAVNPALREQLRQSPLQSGFYVAGLLMVAVGAVTVLVAAPKATPKHGTAAVSHKEPTPPAPAAVEAAPESVASESAPPVMKDGPDPVKTENNDGE